MSWQAIAAMAALTLAQSAAAKKQKKTQNALDLNASKWKTLSGAEIAPQEAAMPWAYDIANVGGKVLNTGMTMNANENQQLADKKALEDSSLADDKLFEAAVAGDKMSKFKLLAKYPNLDFDKM